MNRKWRFLNGVSALGAILFLVAMFKMKGDYYYLRYQYKWLTDDWISIVWVVVSIVYSALPMGCLFVGNVINMIGKKTSDAGEHSKPKISFIIIMSLCLCLGNLVFEIVSLGGAGMTLDDTWMDIVFKMLNYHGLSLLLIVANLIAGYCLYRKQKKLME